MTPDHRTFLPSSCQVQVPPCVEKFNLHELPPPLLTELSVKPLSKGGSCQAMPTITYHGPLSPIPGTNESWTLGRVRGPNTRPHAEMGTGGGTTPFTGDRLRRSHSEMDEGLLEASLRQAPDLPFKLIARTKH